MTRLRLTCGNCKYLAKYPYVTCDIGVESETFYLDKEETIFSSRPIFAYECKKARQLKEKEMSDEEYQDLMKENDRLKNEYKS